MGRCVFIVDNGIEYAVVKWQDKAGNSYIHMQPQAPSLQKHREILELGKRLLAIGEQRDREAEEAALRWSQEEQQLKIECLEAQLELAMFGTKVPIAPTATTIWLLHPLEKTG